MVQGRYPSVHEHVHEQGSSSIDVFMAAPVNESMYPESLEPRETFAKAAESQVSKSVKSLPKNTQSYLM